MGHLVYYGYYMKHKELWNKIAELLRGRDARLITYCCEYLSPPGSVIRLKEVALKDLHYYPHKIMCFCFACEVHCRDLNEEEREKWKCRAGLEDNSCILDWNCGEVGYQFPGCCSILSDSPYKRLVEICDTIRADYRGSIPDPGVYPWRKLAELAEVIAKIPFNKNFYIRR